MFVYDIEESEKEELIKNARKRYLQSIVEKEGAQQAYYNIVHDVVMWNLSEKEIFEGTEVIISFSDGDVKCIYECTYKGEIMYRPYTVKGKLYKSTESTNWGMWKYMRAV